MEYWIKKKCEWVTNGALHAGIIQCDCHRRWYLVFAWLTSDLWQHAFGIELVTQHAHWATCWNTVQTLMGSSPLQFACRASGPTWTRTRTRTRARPCTSSPRSWTPPASPSIKWWEQVRTCNHSDTAARRRWAPSSVSHFENCRRGGTARVVASHKSPSSLPLRPLTFLKSHFKRRKKTKGVLFVAAAGRSDAVRTCTAGNEKHLMPAAQGLFLR